MIQYNNMYKEMKKLILLIILLPAFIGCEGLFEPEIENFRDKESLIKEPDLAQRALGHAYMSHPLRGWSFSDVATDDAVSNDPVNQYMRIATGQWSAINSPMNNNWQTRRSGIQYINYFLSLIDEVQWSANEGINAMIVDRMRGDAHGMRALFMYHLLLEHAGWTENGELLGVPILTEAENIESYFNLPRNTFKECIAQIFSDVVVATENLPLFYTVIDKDEDVPEKYRELGITAPDYTSRGFGPSIADGRMNGAIAEAVLAQAYLLAASPAYSAGSGINWEQAANRLATVLGRLGANPIAQIDANGHKWYESVPSGAGVNPLEILWRGDKERNHSLEEDHFPPTVFGNGRLNPTQNLVDAFPMADGYPATVDNGYDPNLPYNNRDPRLALYIIYNGSTAGANSVVINTAEDGPNSNALNRETGRSTRTGYYMKKHLIQSVRDNSSPNWNDQEHYKAYIRYTEIFLSFAEAANEAWGPTDARMGYSAYSIIRAIRARAGITGGDLYLESIKNDQDAMREMIRNERRLELCFEGHRFWDLRRWNVNIDKLTEPARGMRITNVDTYQPFVVEQRDYSDYMYHAPIPYSEILKFNNLEQNKGW